MRDAVVVQLKGNEVAVEKPTITSSSSPMFYSLPCPHPLHPRFGNAALEGSDAGGCGEDDDASR